MTLFVRVAGVAVLGVSVAACGSSGASEDEAAIHDLMEAWFNAYEDADASALTALFVDDCAGLLDKATDEMAELHRRVTDIRFELTRVDVRNLTESSAEVAPEGVGFLAGEEIELGSGDYASLVKRNGRWKISECEFLAGGF